MNSDCRSGSQSLGGDDFHSPLTDNVTRRANRDGMSGLFPDCGLVAPTLAAGQFGRPL